MKRWIALFVASLAFVSCSKVGAGWGVPGVVRVAFPDNVTSLVPEFAYIEYQIDLGQIYAQPLVGVGENNQPTPVLCTEIPSQANGGISSDGRTITYHLRRGVRFADGVEFTSADVAFTYRAILDPRNPAIDAANYRRIASLETPDPWTVRIRLKQRWPAAVADLFAVGVGGDAILPAHAFHGNMELAKSAWAQRPFGTGPFRVAEWVRGEHIVFVPNPYANPKPRLRKIVVDFIPDGNAAFLGLQNHSVDVAILNESQVQQARAIPGLRVVHQELNGVRFVRFNMQSPRMRPLAVRHAIAQAVNRGAILRDAFQGLSPPATTELAPVLSAHDAAIAPPAYDPVSAKAYFARHPIGTVDLAFSPSDVDVRTAATMLQAQLHAVGVNVMLHAYPLAVFYDHQGPMFQGHFDLGLDDWIGGIVPDDSEWYNCAAAAPAGTDIGRFCDPAYDAAYKRATSSLDPAVRAAAFVAMQRAIAARVAIVPYGAFTEQYGVNPSLEGFRPNMLFIYANVADWELNPK